MWPAWQVREHDGVTSWFQVRLAFPDGARVDALAVVSAGRVSIEDVQAEPALSLADLTALADWIEGPLFAACGVQAGTGAASRAEPEAHAAFGALADTGAACEGDADDPLAFGGYGGAGAASGGYGDDGAASGGYGDDGAASGGYRDEGAASSGVYGDDGAASGAYGDDGAASGVYGDDGAASGGYRDEGAASGVYGDDGAASGAYGDDGAASAVDVGAGVACGEGADAEVAWGVGAASGVARGVGVVGAGAGVDPDAGGPRIWEPRPDAGPAVAGRARPPWPRGTEGRRLVAREYRAAQDAGADPVLAVMNATGRGRRRALRLIAQARDAGLLAPRHARR